MYARVRGAYIVVCSDRGLFRCAAFVRSIRHETVFGFWPSNALYTNISQLSARVPHPGLLLVSCLVAHHTIRHTNTQTHTHTSRFTLLLLLLFTVPWLSRLLCSCRCPLLFVVSSFAVALLRALLTIYVYILLA